MGLFGKKLCPICGGKRGIASFRLAGDERICSACEMLLRGSYDLVKRGAAFYDPLNDLDFYRAKRIIDGLKAEQREDILRFGHAYAGILSVLSVIPVPPVRPEEDESEAAALSGKPVALGFCAYGVFSQGERVYIIGKGRETETTILRLIPCTGAYPFREELIAGTHRTECTENSNAWVILDCDFEEIAVHDKIAACPIRPASPVLE